MSDITTSQNKDWSKSQTTHWCTLYTCISM